MYNMSLVVFGHKINTVTIVLIIIIIIILGTHTFCACCTFRGFNKEGFVGANTNNGQSAPFSLAKYKGLNTSSWGTGSLLVKPGKPLSKAAQSILNRKPQPVPLPKGELLMFANTPFKPSCCPNSYSTSTGCACMTSQQYNYLVTRGGNNVPYSEY
jgi:hypothetical protein